MYRELTEGLVWRCFTYNGFDEILKDIHHDLYYFDGKYINSDFMMNYHIKYNMSESDKGQLQIIFMILVEMFGECGTSPRSGWIYREQFDTLRKYIEHILVDVLEECRRSELI